MSQNVVNPYRFAGAGVDDTGLKSYWKFDQSSGNVTNDSVSDDTLGSGADLTINGSPEYSVASGLSGFGNCMYFNESAGTGDSGIAGTSLSQYGFLHNASDITWTMNFWLLFPATVLENTVIMDSCAIDDEKYGVYMIISSDVSQSFRCLISRGVNNSYVVRAIPTENFIPTDNAFHMYTLTYDESLGSANLKFKRDGANEETFNKSSATAPNDSTYALNIFQKASPADYYAEVKSLEWSTWNRVLTSEEIDTLYNSGSGTPIY